MLRIGQPAAPPKVMPAMPPMADKMPADDQGSDTLQLSPDVARYFGPEARCEGCIHFSAPGSCEVVSGPIDPQGICMVYEADQADDESAEPTPDDESTEPQLPAEAKPA